MLVKDCARYYSLTPTETDIIINVAHGKPLTNVALESEKSIKTVSTQKRNAYKKMGIGSDVEFIHYLYILLIKSKEKKHGLIFHD